MKNGLKRVKKSPVTTTRGQVNGIARARQRRQPLDEPGQLRMELVERARRVRRTARHSARSRSKLPGAPTTRSTCSISTRMSATRIAGERCLASVCRVESAVVVFRPGIEQEQVGQPLLGDEPLEVAHVGIDDAGRAAAHHVEAGDLAGSAVARGSWSSWPMQIGSGRHSRPEVCWRPRSSWLRSSGSTAPACRPSQPAAMASACEWYWEKLGK